MGKFKKNKRAPEFYPRHVELKHQPSGGAVQIHVIRPETLSYIMEAWGLDCGSTYKITHHNKGETNG